jgi:hypothetical protein
MSVTISAKGTSVPYFTIGKTGVTIYQSLSNPHDSYSLRDGDYWLDKSLNALKVWSVATNSWQAPRLADLHFVANSIVAPGGQDLIVSLDPNQFLDINAGGSSPALITTNSGQDLHINPAVAGGQYLVLCANRWPTADGTANQLLMTDGHGTLSFVTPGAAWDSLTVSPGAGSGIPPGYIPQVSSKPVNVPTNYPGYIPIVADTSGANVIWAYINNEWVSMSPVANVPINNI